MYLDVKMHLDPTADPEMVELTRNCQVFLDGHPVKYAIRVDSTEGWVDVNYKNENGTLALNPKELVLLEKRLTGKITLMDKRTGKYVA